MPYHAIESKIWNDEVFIKLSDKARLLFIYLLTSPHSNMVGLYVLRIGYIMSDMGWGSDMVRETMNELLQNDLIALDEPLSIIQIPNFLKYHPIQNPNQFRAAIYCLEQLPPTKLMNSIILYLETVTTRFSKGFRMVAEGLLEPLQQGLSNHDRQKCRSISISTSISNNIVEGEKPSKTFPEDSIEFQLSSTLLEEILKRKPDFKKPNLLSWAEDIDRMIRIDHRLPEQIEKVIAWVQQDQFWQDNILSAAKLRKQFDQLELKMNKAEESETKKPW